MPQLLFCVPTQVDLNKEIEWFKEVKKGHSSVEKTSYGQMDAIMKFGVYQIGTSGKELLRNMNAVLIKLSPSATHGKPSAVFQRKMFSLEQLRDLESRLVLMGGSSSTSQDGATEVTEKDNKKRMEIEEFLQVGWMYFAVSSKCLTMCLYNNIH